MIDKLGDFMKSREYKGKLSKNNFHVFRLDGRNFSKMTKNAEFIKPYDVRFARIMYQVTQDIIQSSGINILYATTHSDEISILVHPQDSQFNLRREKLVSVLSGVASASFAKALFVQDFFYFDDMSTFDCRSVELENARQLIDYFDWRMYDSKRNAVNSSLHYYLVQDLDYSPKQAGSYLKDKGNTERLMLIKEYDIIINEVMKYGSIFYWADYEKQAVHGLTGEPVVAQRKRLTHVGTSELKDSIHSEMLEKILKDVSLVNF